MHRVVGPPLVVSGRASAPISPASVYAIGLFITVTMVNKAYKYNNNNNV